ncbi:MAG: quinone oxidoreductase [Deltaproteobacteria bacterium]|jgi:NADPH2:quinone reductase
MAETTAIRIHETGGPEALRVETIEVGAPGAGEAQIRHTAIGVNFIDTYHRSGLYPLPRMPHGLGQEAAGVVEAVGEGVTEVAVGDRVTYFGGGPGSYCGLRNVKSHLLIQLPDAVSDEVAAASLLKGMTVEYLVRRTFPLQRGQTVLWHAAAGGVGLIACQWLRHLGVEMIGTVSSDEKAALAAENGCTHPIVYTREDFVERTKAITDGAGVPVVYDSVGRDTFERSLKCLARRGTFVGFGNASGKPDLFDLAKLAQGGSLYATRPTLFDYVATREELLESSGALFDVIASGAVKIDIRQRFPLAEAAEAHRALESRATTGSTVLVP